MYELRALCRTCATKIDENENATKLFEENNYPLILLIEDITDLWIEYDNNLPEYICDSCKLTLDNIAEFRENCLATHNKLLATKQKVLQNLDDYIFPFESLIDEEEQEEIEDVESLYTGETELTISETERIEPNDIDVETTALIQTAALDTSPVDQSSSKKKKSNKNSTRVRKGTWICELCGGEFKCSTSLRVHLLRHTGEKAFECDVCTAKYYTKNEMLRHKILHTDARPYACRFCDKTFRGCSSRVVHERTHTNVRPFPCSFCEKRFTSTSMRREHEMVHSENRRFHCEPCDQWFLRYTQLGIHQRTKQHKIKADICTANTI